MTAYATKKFSWEWAHVKTLVFVPSRPKSSWKEENWRKAFPFLSKLMNKNSEPEESIPPPISWSTRKLFAPKVPILIWSWKSDAVGSPTLQSHREKRGIGKKTRKWKKKGVFWQRYLLLWWKLISVWCLSCKSSSNSFLIVYLNESRLF